MKFLLKVAATLLAGASVVAIAADSNSEYVSNGGVKSLRGETELNQEAPAERLKAPRRETGGTLDRNYVYQPPMIPHATRDYPTDLNSNKCLTCHGWKYAGKMGAPKVSPTHFDSRAGVTLANISPRRYFCQQCHVSQDDAAPLVGNTFEPVDALRIDHPAAAQ
ncbi:nitrate reductase cytochrome c-type subunit [Echinimonas agarilytica]|uniref:Periplasmic nitrate reductase, electron transfer subunit n=1 Tax=Echinimonas agarilytica TaxID=1215918 RepID=A0AA42B7E9_9GAMM|nr:nitrate reductase cytochrome c-type subunit [Echinimonas agarilytica]MCM2679732.1 nitrate reductase cytochrome c-type subunit [Echinimonas agarilytica]